MEQTRHSSTAAPLALGAALLIVYASLYPFSGWRVTADPWWLFLTQWPRYWLRFDVISNWLGYIPLGFLGAAALLSQRPPHSPRPWGALLLVAVACSALSLTMEITQNYLPWRVPSLADWLLNSAGGMTGILCANLAQKWGWFRLWQAWRERSMEPHTRAIFVHLFLWPFALLFPTSLPFGLGQFYERLEAALVQWLQGTPFLRFIPFRAFEFEPMLPVMQSTSVALGLLMPLWSLDLLLRSKWARLGGHVLVLVCGILVLGLSYALSYDPWNAWIWLAPPVLLGIAAAAIISSMTLAAPRVLLAVGILLAVGLQTILLNQASTSSYANIDMQYWEQGSFVRFYGLGQWLGWLWPYLMAIFVLVFLWALAAKQWQRLRRQNLQPEPAATDLA